MATSQFMDIQGREVIVTSRPCGCWHETRYDHVDGSIQLIRLQICSSCFTAAGEYLEVLDKQRQLQLGLPLTDGDGERE